METATSIVLVITAAANIAIAIADLARAEFVMANSAEVGVPDRWLPLLAVLKGTGGAGLLLWFADVAVLPVLAAAGLVCFFLVANAAHVRARVFHNIGFPGVYLTLAIASLCLIVAAS